MTSQCPPDKFHSNWAQYTENIRFDINPDIAVEL